MADLNSSDDEELHRVEKRKRKTRNVINSSESDEDSDIEVKKKKNVRILPCDSDSEFPCESSNVNDSSHGFASWSNVSAENDGALANDSDNEQTDKCAICLSKFSGQDVATPETCDHTFCLDCLQKWAQKVNTCPIDRLKFNLILIRHHKKEKIIRRISVENPAHFFEVESNSSESTYCELCGDSENEETLLTCDECAQAYHCECLTPPLTSVPIGPWFCPDCTTTIRLRKDFINFRDNDYQHMIQNHYRNELNESSISRSSSSLQSTNQDATSRRAYQSKYQEIGRRSLPRMTGSYENSYLSSSDSSSDDDTVQNRTSTDFATLFQAFKFRPLNLARQMSLSVRQKYMTNLRDIGTDFRSFSSATTVTAVAQRRNAELTDSDDDFSNQRESSVPSSDNYDLVGTILQSQSILHCPGMTARRDGSVLFSGANGARQPTMPRNTNISADSSSNEVKNVISRVLVPSETSTLSIDCSPTLAMQCPLNPMQSPSSKYNEVPGQTPGYSCETSTSGGSSLYDTSTLSQTTHDNSSLDQLSSGSHASEQRSYDSCSTSESMKTDHQNSSNLKDASKSHSEDEVDIYSDIESVGEEEAAINNKMEPIKIDFKCDESQLNVGGDASDSSDNELVIDEDLKAEEEHDKMKDSTQSSSVTKDEPFCSEINHTQSEDSNNSVLQNLDFDSHPNIETNSSCQPFDNMEDNSFENYHSPLQDNKYLTEHLSSENSPSSSKQIVNTSEEKSECESETATHESDVDMEIYEDNSVDSTKKSFRTESGTPCSINSSPKPFVEESQCENSASNENITFEDNHAFSHFRNSSATDDEQSKHAADCKHENTGDSSAQMEENENSLQSFNSDQGELEDSQGNMTPTHDMNESCEKYADDGSESVLGSEDNPACDTSMQMEVNEEINENFTQNENTLCFDENEVSSENSENVGNECKISSKTSMKNEDMNMFSDNEGKITFLSLKTMNIDTSERFSDLDKKNYNSKPVTNSIEQFDPSLEKNIASDGDVQEIASTEPGIVDLGIEDISDSESGDLNGDYSNDIIPDNSEEQKLSVEEQVQNLFLNSEMEDEAKDSHINKSSSDHSKSHSLSNHSYDDQEEGEIIEERPERKKTKKREVKHDNYREENDDYGDLAPRVNISDLPRIPKIKRNKEKSDSVEVICDVKRTSVLGRVDLGGVDISWKRLSKHTRERSYRDGRPKDERLLYRERESRSKDKKSVNENDRRHSKNKESDHRRDDKKQEFERFKSERERKTDRNKDREKSKSIEWVHSGQDKSEKHERSHKEREKSHKEREKRTKDKDKRDKERHDKSRHSKSEDKHDRDKSKEDVRYEREVIRYDRGEERFERVVYEKGKLKEKDHKSKRKDRKSESTKSNIKERSRDKHKHIHSSEHFSDKQKEREVRKIDDKLKIVLEQKETRKDKNEKHSGKKEQKREKKHREEICHHEHKKERSISPYTELAPIESKEIFAKGDSIIINVNFNRASEKEVVISEEKNSASKENKLSSNVEPDEITLLSESKSKTKSTSDKRNSMDVSLSKRPSTPPERNIPKIPVGECYWQENDETDANSLTTEKSVEENACIEDDDTMGSTGGFEDDNNYSDSSGSCELLEPQPVSQTDSHDVEQSTNVQEKSTDNAFQKENEAFLLPRRKSPRSPSPPSPADNDSYDPCEPTKSPSPPPPIPPAPPLPVPNPKPPPSPELPPLPPDPEPSDVATKEEQMPLTQTLPVQSDFMVVTSAVMGPTSQSIVAHAQTTAASTVPMSSVLAPPPFLTHAPSNTSVPSLAPLMQPSNFNFQLSSHPTLMFPANHVQQVMQHNNFVPAQMHATNNMQHASAAHMGTIPPPPPHGAMPIMSHVRHPQLHGQISASSLLQNMQMGHQVNIPQLQLTHLHHLPPALANVLANHHSPMIVSSQNQSVSLPVTIHNQQVSRGVLPHGQLPNNQLSIQNLQNLNLMHMQSHSGNLNQTQNQVPVPVTKQLRHSSPIDKSEVVDMDVDSPYSPGDSPSLDSGCDYSPTCSPIANVPKMSNAGKQTFDSLLPSEQKIIRNQDSKSDRSRSHSESKNSLETPTKKARIDSKRHSVRMQMAEKNKNSRKEQKLAEKRELSKLDDSQLTILDELPSSAVEMQVKEKFLKKLNRQERVVEEVKLSLKPYYKSRDVTKEEYKDILRRTVPKICHNRSGEINPVKVKCLVESYIKKVKHAKKKSRKSRKMTKFS